MPQPPIPRRTAPAAILIAGVLTATAILLNAAYGTPPPNLTHVTGLDPAVPSLDAPDGR